MTVLVIGGSGFIGSTVVKSLAAKNIEAVCYDLIHTDSNGDKNNWIRADILELQSIERIFFEYNIDSIIHLVGLPAVDQCAKNPHFSFLLNVMSVQHALEAMRMADIPKIVFASSASVYGTTSGKQIVESDVPKPTTVYGWHKLLAENAIRTYSDAYGIKSVILRLFNVYGGNPKLGKEVISIFINRALKNEPLLVKGPEKFRDFIHMEDVAEVFTKALTSPAADNMTVNIGTGKKTTLKQVASIVNAYFPTSKTIVEPAQDDGTGLFANSDVARKLLDFSPRDPLRGIDAHVKKYSDQGA